MIRSFLGLYNFIIAHIRDYAAISAPLNRLLRKETSYKGGALPDDAMEAFVRLKRILCSAPILALPDADKQVLKDYSLCGKACIIVYSRLRCSLLQVYSRFTLS